MNAEAEAALMIATSEDAALKETSMDAGNATPFPCEKGFFADEVWKGLCIGFTKCIKDKGIEKFVGLVESKLGKMIEYGEFRSKKEEEITAILCGEGR